MTEFEIGNFFDFRGSGPLAKYASVSLVLYVVVNMKWFVNNRCSGHEDYEHACLLGKPQITILCFHIMFKTLR